MEQIKTTNTKLNFHWNRNIAYIVIFFLIMIAGLIYVKWVPYFEKAHIAASTHSIGKSIIGNTHSQETISSSAWSYVVLYFSAVWKAAILGIVLGSLLQVLIPTNWLLKMLGKTNFGSTAAAGLASLPTMMCTCCAAPIAVGLRKKKASVGASLAFWIGNPTLNPATLVFMTFVLSWKFTVIRLFFGLILTFGVSYLANRFVNDVDQDDLEEMISKSEEGVTGPFLSRWLKSMGKMALYIVPTYFLSVLFIGALRIWLFPTISVTMANGLLAIIGFALVGMLFVIPTAAEIPIIQTFMSLGLSSGPAGALLITLPAISLPSLIMVGRSFPKKVLFFVASSVVLLGIVSGILCIYI